MAFDVISGHKHTQLLPWSMKSSPRLSFGPSGWAPQPPRHGLGARRRASGRTYTHTHRRYYYDLYAFKYVSCTREAAAPLPPPPSLPPWPPGIEITFRTISSPASSDSDPAESESTRNLLLLTASGVTPTRRPARRRPTWGPERGGECGGETAGVISGPGFLCYRRWLCTTAATAACLRCSSQWNEPSTRAVTWPASRDPGRCCCHWWLYANEVHNNNNYKIHKGICYRIICLCIWKHVGSNKSISQRLEFFF